MAPGSLRRGKRVESAVFVKDVGILGKISVGPERGLPRVQRRRAVPLASHHSPRSEEAVAPVVFQDHLGNEGFSSCDAIVC